MKLTYAKRNLFYVGIMILLCHTALGFSEFTQLSLQISTESPVVLPMEPLPITITLSNDSNRSIWASPAISPNEGNLEVLIKSEDGDYELFPTADWPLASTVMETVKLEPGYKRQVEGFLYFAQPAVSNRFDPNNFSRQHLLPEPGDYQVKAVLKNLDDQNKIESNIITIRVLQPTGSDALAFEYIKNIREPYFLMRTLDKDWTEKNGQFLSAQEDFLKQFPASKYSCYVNYSLGQTYIMKGGDFLNSGTRMLEQAADIEGFFLADKALSQLVTVSLKINNVDKAQYYYNILKTRFPNSPENKVALSQINKVLFDTKK